MIFFCAQGAQAYNQALNPDPKFRPSLQKYYWYWGCHNNHMGHPPPPTFNHEGVLQQKMLKVKKSPLGPVRQGIGDLDFGLTICLSLSDEVYSSLT